MLTLLKVNSSSSSSARVIFLCVLIFVSALSPTHGIEDSNDYSMSSLLPSIKTFFFWRTDKSTEEKIPITENDVYKTVPDTEESTTDYRHANIESTNPNLSNNLNLNRRPTFLEKDNRICHSCVKNNMVFLTEDEEIRQRIEYIKEQILTRLGMKKPPQLKPDIDLSLYMRLAENTISQRELAELGPTRSAEPEAAEEVDKAFILPSKPYSKRPTFNLSSVNTSDPSKTIKAIYILVNYNLTKNYYRIRLHDTDLIITSESGEDNDISPNFGLPRTVSPMTPSEGSEPSYESSRWFQYDVTTLLSDNSAKTIQIHNEDFEILSSVILIEMGNNKLTRAKRSIDCTDNGSFCCRQHFYVNFTTIGWNNWIFQPPGYNANYCKGKCDLSHARYHHTTVIGKYPAIKLCCSPREMSSISLIYMDDKFNIYQKNLPNMVVESCDCA